ncbi:peptide ABC transporter substrate-binding protein [Hespellia stercorisuis]|uniref:Oligopeptide transport system substrate-binding protein n=1 Tax=Hespellia stercorisuis DSM 15480 TaxID=1121950 RepID=A0A1M6KLY6_9FIRM|nr:peptide ABC transporter substrate-binding protein [Hespellia stercorisuis]SHJ59941.1 oligopeptide transport system substrate-binding protein [Hespellia stercorisuis DSM 15480]
MKKRVLSILMAGALALALTACGGGGSDSKNAESGEKDSEQYINTYLYAEPTTMDPSLRSDQYSSEILISTMEGLIRMEQRDGEYEAEPGDAESWETSEDGKVWTFHLGEDRKWSDGEPVTADQYVYSLRRSADPATGCPNSYFVTPILNYDAVSTGEMAPDQLGVKAVDEHTLEITLTNPMPSFLESTDASVFYPQREDIVKEYGDQYGADAEKFVYNGPFTISEWVHNSSMKLVKNEQYWDSDNVDLETVNYQIMADASTIANAYDSGQIDTIDISSEEELQKYEADDSNKYTKISGGSIVFQFYNTTDKTFSNQNIRKAFTLAIDQEDMNEMGFGNLREPLYGWIAPAFSVDGKSMRDAAGDPLKDRKAELEKEGKTPKDVLIEGMEELGLGSDPSKLDVTYSLAGTDDWYRTFGEYLQQVYKDELGVNLKIDFTEWGIFSDNLANGNYQIGFMSWGAYFNDPYDMLSINMTDFNQISTNWSNPEYDRLCVAGATEMDADKRMDDYVQAEKILMENDVICPLATSVEHKFTKSYVHDKYEEYGEERLYFIHPGWKNVYTSGR